MIGRGVAIGPSDASPHLTGPAVARPRSGRRRAFGPGAWGLVLVAPAIALLVVALIVPIVGFLSRSIANPEVPDVLPRTVVALASWDGRGLPPEDAFAALRADLAEAARTDQAGILARRLNFELTGARTLVFRTASRLAEPRPEARAELVAIDRRWGEPEIWAILKRESGRFTPFYYLVAADLRTGPDGAVARAPEPERIFLGLFGRTLSISVSTTILCLLLGYPAAYLLATASSRWVPVLMALVLLPFWTSTLVRTTAWIVLLQNEGLVNRALRYVGIIAGSLPMFGNRFAVLVAMTHVLLPYMILPLYGVMKTVPPELARAASGLGADPFRAFYRVYLPQTLPGIFAGSLLVFILALGYYVTPALVGAPSDQMISYFVALYTNETLNWGLASALGTMLLAMTALIYLVALKLGVKVGLS